VETDDAMEVDDENAPDTNLPKAFDDDPFAIESSSKKRSRTRLSYDITAILKMNKEEVYKLVIKDYSSLSLVEAPIWKNNSCATDAFIMCCYWLYRKTVFFECTLTDESSMKLLQTVLNQWNPRSKSLH